LVVALCVFDELANRGVAIAGSNYIRDRLNPLCRGAADNQKKTPLCGGVHWSLACLFVEEFFALLVLVRCGLCRAACSRESKPCARGFLRHIACANRGVEARARAKREFGQYVTSDVADLLSKSPTPKTPVGATFRRPAGKMSCGTINYP
jgi:hypothetical protein